MVRHSMDNGATNDEDVDDSLGTPSKLQCVSHLSIGHWRPRCIRTYTCNMYTTLQHATTNNNLNYMYRIRHRSFAVLHINEFSSFRLNFFLHSSFFCCSTLFTLLVLLLLYCCYSHSSHVYFVLISILLLLRWFFSVCS